MKVALYARVSTEEQARHGLSIDTQLDSLRAWAKENGHTVIGEYVDAGVSARKAPAKRPELQRLLGDLDKIELIAFTKLDRWTRNIKGYYDVQEKLDAAKVSWTATLESYETVTSNGRFKVNILLAVNEQEADRTSERIKVVMERKIAKGEHIGPNPPLGYSVVDKHFVPDDNADIARGTFRAYLDSGSIRTAMDYLHDHGFPFIYDSTKKMLNNTIYKGQYRGNYSYCEPIISTEDFDRVQGMLQERSVRRNQTGREYVFSSMITCAECGYKMVAAYHYKMPENKRYRYRCDRHYLHRLCDNKQFVYESELEETLISMLEADIASMDIKVKPKQKKRKAPDNTKKLERLNELYIEGAISKEQFTEKRNQLMSVPAEPPTPDYSAISKIALSDNIRESYYNLSKPERRALWKAIIEKLEVSGSIVDITFRA